MHHDRMPSVPRRRIGRGVVALTAVLIGLGAAAGVTPSGSPAQAATTTGDACGATIRKANGVPWTCTFVDTFSGTSLNTHSWTIATTAKTGFFIGRTCMTANNVAVGGGVLQLTARDLGRQIVCSTPYGSFTTRYTGAHLGTIGTFAQTYGRYEVRARYPQTGSGLHGGYWLYPVKPVYGAWPASGEIDVAEWWSSAPHTVLPTLHFTGSDSSDSGWSCTVADPYAWHTYAVEWSATLMQFSIDGRTCFTDRWSQSWLFPSRPFNRPFNIILNMAVDDSRYNPVTSTTRWPSVYEVDYVKAWK